MTKTVPNKTVLYDPIQHFHTGFHQPMIDAPPKHIRYTSGHIDYYFYNEMHAPEHTPESKSVLMLGEMKGRGDVIFSPHTLLINATPWIVDIEHVDWFFMNNYLGVPEQNFIPLWKKTIAQNMLRSSHCKGILCRSKHARKSVQDFFHDDLITRKCVLFYPAQPVRPLVQNRGPDVTLGFIASSYADIKRKGGDIAIDVFRVLKKKHPSLRFIYVGNLPSQPILFRPKSFPPGFFHYDHLPYKKLVHRVMPHIDILLMPSRADTFGTSALEIMSYGKPVVTSVSNHVYSIGEIINDGVTGCTVTSPNDNRPIHANAAKINIREFIQKTDMLITHQNLRLKIGHNARELFKTTLSLQRMNSILTNTLRGVDNLP